jgi:hypothetical protein
MYTRANAKWTVNECLRLEREFDLLNLSVQEIALLHDRSPNAIMYKLDAEGIADYNDVFINRQSLKVETKDESESELDDDDTSNYQEEEEEEFDSYNIKQQVQIITKQLSNLTAIVYKALSPSSSNVSSFR